MKWCVSEFEIIQVTAAPPGLVMVFEQEDGTKDKVPIKMLGLVIETLVWLYRPDDAPIGTQTREEKRAPDTGRVLALDLSSGYFVVADEADNYCGIYPEDADVSTAYPIRQKPPITP